MGGLPDFPLGMAWPQGETDSGEIGCLTFVLQLNLAEIDPQAKHGLPAEGMLYFFAGNDEESIDVKHQLAWAPDLTGLARTPCPVSLHENLVPHSLSIVHGIGTPGLDDSFWYDLEDGREDTLDRDLKLLSLLSGIHEREEMAGKLFGYQSRDRGSQLEDVALIDLGLPEIVFHPKSIEIFDRNIAEAQHKGLLEHAERLLSLRDKILFYEQHQDEVRAAMDKWCSFLWIDSNFKVGFNIWDAGSYSIMIRHSDLEARRFDRTHGVLSTC